MDCDIQSQQEAGMSDELTSTPDGSVPVPQLRILGEAAAQEILSVQSTDLLQGHSEVLIVHGADTYRLRLTRNGKLILHK